MSKFVIEKGIKKESYTYKKYPFRVMEVGDSVFIEGQKTNGNAYAAARQHGRYAGKKFSASSQPDGCRIWRTA